MASKTHQGRRWLVRGRVQGVGFRYFARHSASALGLRGYTRNLDDGRVEVYAVGPPEKLSEMAALLHKGPRWADVRGVEEQEAEVRSFSDFQIEG
jgi:acylphosphatase